MYQIRNHTRKQKVLLKTKMESQRTSLTTDIELLPFLHVSADRVRTNIAPCINELVIPENFVFGIGRNP